MNGKMTAAVLYGKEDVRIEKVPIPEVGDGEVLVKVEVALTCGTDLKVFNRGYHARMIVPPALFGHELAGTIVEVGAGVAPHFKKGTRVVALNSAPCGACFFCKRHQENLCEDLLFNNGAYAEYIKIPRRIVEANMLELPKTVSYESAAITEPLACVVRGLQETYPEIGDTVVVIGAGPIGLMFMQVAKVAGCNVIAVVKRDEQVQSAKRFGADDVVQITKVEDAVQATRTLTPQRRGADIVIEAVGRPLGWQWAVEMARKGGTVNFFGGCAKGTKVELDTNLLHYSEITLKASFHHTPDTVRKAFNLIKARQDQEHGLRDRRGAALAVARGAAEHVGPRRRDQDGDHSRPLAAELPRDDDCQHYRAGLGSASA
jgi:L-iditol 2-dehydrogenase